MDISKLNKLMLELLEADCFKAIDYLVEEFRIEYPQEYRQVMKDFQEEYDLSGCGAEMSPVTAVSFSLNSLLDEDKVEKKKENGLSMWRLKPIISQ
ncbi:MAG: hypothetical protein AAGU27_18930 [Dehalobacterium sp.]